jgi:hypothetical protein
MDSYRELVSIYTISFVINLYLILLINVQTSDVTGISLVQESKRPLARVKIWDSSLQLLVGCQLA